MLSSNTFGISLALALYLTLVCGCKTGKSQIKGDIDGGDGGGHEAAARAAVESQASIVFRQAINRLNHHATLFATKDNPLERYRNEIQVDGWLALKAFLDKFWVDGVEVQWLRDASIWEKVRVESGASCQVSLLAHFNEGHLVFLIGPDFFTGQEVEKLSSLEPHRVVFAGKERLQSIGNQVVHQFLAALDLANACTLISFDYSDKNEALAWQIQENDELKNGLYRVQAGNHLSWGIPEILQDFKGTRFQIRASLASTPFAVQKASGVPAVDCDRRDGSIISAKFLHSEPHPDSCNLLIAKKHSHVEVENWGPAFIRVRAMDSLGNVVQKGFARWDDLSLMEVALPKGSSRISKIPVGTMETAPERSGVSAALSKEFKNAVLDFLGRSRWNVERAFSIIRERDAYQRHHVDGWTALHRFLSSDWQEAVDVEVVARDFLKPPSNVSSSCPGGDGGKIQAINHLKNGMIKIEVGRSFLEESDPNYRALLAVHEILGALGVEGTCNYRFSRQHALVLARKKRTNRFLNDLFQLNNDKLKSNLYQIAGRSWGVPELLANYTGRRFDLRTSKQKVTWAEKGSVHSREVSGKIITDHPESHSVNRRVLSPFDHVRVDIWGLEFSRVSVFSKGKIVDQGFTANQYLRVAP